MIASLFNVENFLAHMVVDEDEPERPIARGILAESLVGVQDIVNGLQTLEYATPPDYRKLEVLDVLTEGYVSRILNENGYACATCCPGCHADDFTHVEGCKVGFVHQHAVD